MDEIQKGSKNAEIVLDFTNIDLADATSVVIYFRKSGGTKIGPYTATKFVDTDGRTKAKYVTPDTSFLDRVGKWSVQGYVSYPGGGFVGPSEVGSFEVLGNIFP